jgi:superfamily II DNA or RNA helicase
MMTTTTYQLRNYQQELINRIFDRWRLDLYRVMAQLPTGGGKSAIFSAIAARVASWGCRILVIAHTEELVTQNAGHLERWCHTSVGIIKAGYTPDYELPIQSASIQSLVNRFDDVGEFDLIIIDEAHRSSSDTYLQVFARFPTARVLGVTATPIRSDGKGFNRLYDCLECGISTAKLIEMGYLSPYRLFADPRPMQTRGAKTQMGDYSLSDLARMNDAIELAGSLVGSYQKYVNGGSCIVFAINVEHSQSIAAAYNHHSIPAIHLDADTDRFTRRRALRISEGKEHGIILDHTDNYDRLGLPDDDRYWRLEGKPKRLKQIEDERLEPRIEREPKIIEEIPDIQLVEVGRETIEQHWADLFARLVLQQQANNYKPAWVAFKLAQVKPPLAVWEKAASYLGYKKGWAWHKYQDSSPK